MSPVLSYALQGATVEALSESLGGDLEIAVGSSRRHRRVAFYDTFDWRLWRQGVELRAEGDSLVGRELGSGTEIGRAPLDGTPGFAHQLPAGRLGKRLAPVVGVRRLLSMGWLEVDESGLRVLDERRKTVVRGALEQTRTAGPRAVELPPRIVLRSVRGYDDELAAVVEALERGLGLRPVERSDVALAARGVGRRPGDYSSKLDVRLDPTMRSDVALRLIHLRLLEIARANVDGVVEDTDTEFLHDFRVALRRTRSGLGQLDGVYPADETEHFRGELRWLFRRTGPTRDLDVYLLKIPAYRASLPEAVRADLDPLEAFLRRRQAEEQAKLAASLRSPRARGTLASWRSYLESDLPDPPPEDGGRPIGEVARERIGRVWRRVLEGGAAIGPETPDEQVHRLRIEAKRLRYLLEFFSSLFPSRQRRVVRALKRLQDTLGDFNDYVVQREHLRRYAVEMEESGEATPDALLAMGRLVARLEAGQHAERQAFHRRFETFARRRHRRLMDEMLGEEER